MAEPDPLLPLVRAWQEARARGRDLRPEDLCGDRPELAEQLAARIADLAATDPHPTTPPRPFRAPAPGLNDPRIPAKIANYKIVGLLGKGGMGAVFRAEDVNLGRLVALKVIHPSMADDMTIRVRFMREARAQAAVEHDNVLPIYQVGQEDGVMFIATPLLQGETLEERLKRDRVLALGTSLKVAGEVADGLAAAHAKGLIHRDIKPSNVWLEGDPQAADPAARLRRCKILDFGLALPTDVSARLTVRGAFLGTPAYMAPEQAGGGKVDARTDLFSLGVMLYEMVVGRDPFFGPTPAAAIVNVATVEPPPAREVNPAVPQELSDLIARLVAKTADKRPGSAREVADELARIARRLPNPDAKPPPSRPEFALPPPEPAGDDTAGGGTAKGTIGSAAGATGTFPPQPAPQPVRRAAHPDPTELDASWRPAGRDRSRRAVIGMVAAAAAVLAAVGLAVVFFNRGPDGSGGKLPDPPPPPPPEVAVRVTVNAPGAAVRLLGEPAAAPALGAAAGEFVFRLPADRKRTVRAEAHGFAPKEVEIDPAAKAEYAITLAPEMMRVVLRQLPPGAVVAFPDDPDAKPVPAAPGEYAARRKPQRVEVTAPGYVGVTVPIGLPAAGSDRVEVAVPLKPEPPVKEYAGPAGVEFRLIPAGTLTLGVAGTTDPVLADQPPREVTITRPFYLGRTEVTRGQFRKFVEEAKYKTEAEASAAGGFGYVPGADGWFERDRRFTWRDAGFDQTDDHPVVNVTWNDAKAFCEWLGRKEKRVFRLPTEAEWEYAARSGAAGRFPPDDPAELGAAANVADAAARKRFGADSPRKVPKCFGCDDGYPFTAPAGRLKPNGHGLADVLGNVLEWCEDWYGPVGGLPKADPVQATRNGSNRRVARGGSFLTGSGPFLLARYPVAADQPSAQLGFRVCAEAGRP